MMPHIITFPTTTTGEDSASPASAEVIPIRKGGRVPRKPRKEDLQVATNAQAIRVWREHIADAEDAGRNSGVDRVLLETTARKLPRNNLRCIASTLDERRDFDLRCTEVEIIRAEHTLEARRIDRLGYFEAGPWWESSTLKPLVDANNRLWEVYRARLVELAQTPAHTYAQLDRKRRLIGKGWLSGDTSFSVALREGVERDEAWLAENQFKAKRGAK